MNEDTNEKVTGAQEVLAAARDILNTIPPDDPSADRAAGLIHFIDCDRPRDKGDPVCAICGKPPRYLYSWRKVPVPDEPDLWLCEEHRDHAEERDESWDYGLRYVKNAAGLDPNKNYDEDRYYLYEYPDGERRVFRVTVENPGGRLNRWTADCYHVLEEAPADAWDRYDHDRGQADHRRGVQAAHGLLQRG